MSGCLEESSKDSIVSEKPTRGFRKSVNVKDEQGRADKNIVLEDFLEAVIPGSCLLTHEDVGKVATPHFSIHG